MRKSDVGLTQGVWGLRISRRTKAKWRSLSVLVNVPVSWLIDYVLEDWLAGNTEVFGEIERGKLRKAIVDSHRADDKPTAPPIISNDDFPHLRTNLSIRNVGMETRLKFKIMASDRKMSMNRLLDDMVRGEWEKIGNQPASSGLSAKIRKEVKKLFEEQSATPIRGTLLPGGNRNEAQVGTRFSMGQVIRKVAVAEQKRADWVAANRISLLG